MPRVRLMSTVTLRTQEILANVSTQSKYNNRIEATMKNLSIQEKLSPVLQPLSQTFTKQLRWQLVKQEVGPTRNFDGNEDTCKNYSRSNQFFLSFPVFSLQRQSLRITTDKFTIRIPLSNCNNFEANILDRQLKSAIGRPNVSNLQEN